ncbi:MAG: hypothetical protein VKM92_04140 [Cyanobacteriota bacterium]|nr:hypothetical protein [Cyanobacteriota bacterium]
MESIQPLKVIQLVILTMGTKRQSWVQALRQFFCGNRITCCIGDINQDTGALFRLQLLLKADIFFDGFQKVFELFFWH